MGKGKDGALSPEELKRAREIGAVVFRALSAEVLDANDGADVAAIGLVAVLGSLTGRTCPPGWDARKAWELVTSPSIFEIFKGCFADQRAKRSVDELAAAVARGSDDRDERSN